MHVRPTTHRIAALMLAVLLTPALGLRAQSGGVEAGVQLYRAHKLDEARAALQSAAASGNHEALFWTGRVLYDQKKTDEATEYFERAVKANDASSEYHLWLGQAYADQAQRANVLKKPMLAKRVKTEFDLAVARDPNNLDAHAAEIAFYMQAPGIMGGSHDKAKQEAEVVRKINPYRGAIEAANIAESEKNIAAAESEYRALIKAYPDSSAPWIRLIIAEQNAQKWSDAFALIDAALAKHPDNESAIYQLGKTAALSGQRLDDGEAALKKYLAAPSKPGQPSPAGAHLRLGQIAEKRGNVTAARIEYETAVQLDPKLQEAKKSLERVRQ